MDIKVVMQRIGIDSFDVLMKSECLDIHSESTLYKCANPSLDSVRKQIIFHGVDGRHVLAEEVGGVTLVNGPDMYIYLIPVRVSR